MTADKSKANMPAPRCTSQPIGDVLAVPTEQRPEQLRSAMRPPSSARGDHSVHIEGLPRGQDDARTMRVSDSAASLASTAADSYARSSSRANSESSISLDQHPTGSSPAKLPPIPRGFMCPVSCQVMTDPVSTVDGMVYDRTNIEGFKSGRQTSPVTGQQLASLKLLPNPALKEAIEAYMELHREAECQWKDWQAYLEEHKLRTEQKLAKKKMQIRELRAALEASERQVLALELGSKPSSKGGYARSNHSNTSSAPSSTDESSALESPPSSAVESGWKAGPAPRPETGVSKAPERSRSLLSMISFRN
mmetsp:Transcript_22246/g.56672  ORF Transcript_22246/g.56672 Transcript_22246/m.56672 type:complete len:307 (-) Transcript_22246:739-1659(-)